MASQPDVAMAPDPAGVQVQRLFTNFLEEYRADSPDGLSADEPVYVRWLQQMKDADRTTLYVEFNHLVECVRAGRARTTRGHSQGSRR